MPRTQKKSKSGFSDATKATIFAWDRAVCAFTGASVWLLDHELSPCFTEDWMDHIIPVARGGSSLPENGICADAGMNWIKGANGRANNYWFVGGRPTSGFYETLGKVSPETARYLHRTVEPRDWYYNPCLRNLRY